MAAATSRKLINEFVTVETTDATPTEALVLNIPVGWFGRVTAEISAQDANSSGGFLYGKISAYIYTGGISDVGTGYDGTAAGTIATAVGTWIDSVSGDPAVQVTGVAGRTIGWSIRVRGEIQHYPLSGG